MLDGKKTTLEMFMSDQDDLIRMAFLDQDGNVYIRSALLNQHLHDMLIILKDKMKRSIERAKEANQIRYIYDEEHEKFQAVIH
jgi:hypothetical protein